MEGSLQQSVVRLGTYLVLTTTAVTAAAGTAFSIAGLEGGICDPRRGMVRVLA